MIEERTSPPDSLLTVRMVAGQLRLSESAVRNLMRRGGLPYVNLALGSRLAPRIRQVDLDEFIRKRLQSGGRL